MIKIALFCTQGFTSNFLVNRMKKAAIDNGINAEITAFPEGELPNHLDGVNLVLLVPQARYVLPKAKALCDPLNIPIDVISSVNYGMMYGGKILDNAMQFLTFNAKKTKLVF